MKTENPVILADLADNLGKLKALSLSLGADAGDIAEFTTTGTPYSVVRVSARKG